MQPQRNSLYVRFVKRGMDIALALSALILLTPVLLALAILVRVFLGSPVLFRQERTGYRGKRFTILKFRTMTNAHDEKGNLLSDSDRLTRFGCWLRRSSLDELPELWNVIKGEMSLVGPRPLLPRYDKYYTQREATRFDLRPGITGWAQINGRNDLPWDDRLECDASYVESCSFLLDLKILCLTVLKVLRKENIQEDPGKTFCALDEERLQRAMSKRSDRTGDAIAPPTPAIPL